MDRISLRELNRTFLLRQHLLGGATETVTDVVRQLVAVQAQEPNWAIIALRARVPGLGRDEIGRLTAERALVRTPLLRGTQHLVTADDYGWLRPSVQPLLDRLLRSPYYREQTGGIPPEELVAAAREALGDGLVTRRQIAAALTERYPGRRGAVLVAAAESLMPVAHDPATSAWGSWSSRRSIGLSAAEAWLGRPAERPDVPQLIRRYLAAFGPAAVMDVQAWSGLTRLREVIDAIRGELRAVVGPDGAELFDLPEAPSLGADAETPVRFLGAFDNAVLGHRDRTRILPEGVRREVMPGYSMVHATVLVDGFVAARWEVHGDDVVVRTLRPLARSKRDGVLAEGETVRRFVVDGPGDVRLA
jgi:hypothetical protein